MSPHAAGGGGFAGEVGVVGFLNAVVTEGRDGQALVEVAEIRDGVFGLGVVGTGGQQAGNGFEARQGSLIAVRPQLFQVRVPYRSEQGGADGTVGRVELPAEGRGEPVDRAEPGIGEGHAAEQGGEGEVFAGVEIGVIGDGDFERSHRAANAFEAEGVGHRLRLSRNVGFEALHQGVHATGGGDGRRAVAGEFGVDERDGRQHRVMAQADL